MFENPDFQTLWSEREDILKWCSIASYLVYVYETGDRIEGENHSTRRKDFPIIAWGVHFEAAMYFGGYLAGFCVLRLMYDLFVKLRMVMGVVGICGIIVRLLARENGRSDAEEKISSNHFSRVPSPESHLDEVSAEEIEGDSEVWSSDGMLTPPSIPDLGGYYEEFEYEYEEWDCWAE